MLPEAYTAPFGGPVAALVVVGDLVWFALMFLKPLPSQGPRRRYLPFVAAAVSLGAVLILAVPYWQVWAGNGYFWCAVQATGLNERLAENLLLWIPVLLLTASMALVSLSRERLGRLTLWAILTSPGLLVALYAAALLGLTVSPS